MYKRQVINKNVTWDQIERGCRIAFSEGYTSVKLYFMMGLPTETLDDIKGIADKMCIRDRLLGGGDSTSVECTLDVNGLGLFTKPAKLMNERLEMLRQTLGA